MQNIPVDVGRLALAMVVGLPEPRVNQEGEQRKNRDGELLWVVSVAVRRADARRADVIEVAVPGEPVGLTEGGRVVLVDLEAVQWSMGDRSGISWRASSITAEGGAAPAPASGSGSASGSGRGKSGGER
jgi:antitoxin (DNA-binding transcriptional repressor) of toxin-antitoxin stability system